MPSPDPAAPPPAARLLTAAGAALVFAYLAFLAIAWQRGLWLTDAAGHGVATDFVNVFAAGRLALAGTPAAAWDWSLHRAAEVAALGTDFHGYFGWHYPPPFLAIAALLALLPYAPALLLWEGVTLLGYLAAIRAILPGRAALIAALAFPATLWNVAVGQNGFFTAALIGGALVLMERRRPILAGVLIGLLTYKPQFGLALPFVLAAAGAWRAFGAASATALALAAGSLALFGIESWSAFLVSLGQTTEAVMHDGRADLAKLHSVFGLARTLGAGHSLAWGLHGAVAIAAIAATALLWRRPACFDLKAAALGLASLIASPYVYIYDLAALAVPIAFLLRHAAATGLQSGERDGLLLASGLLLAFAVLPFPTGIVSLALVAAFLARRVNAELGRPVEGYPRVAERG